MIIPWKHRLIYVAAAEPPNAPSSVGGSPHVHAAPSVDVGLPVALRATFLPDAIESVLGQSFEAWRLVVSDNGPGGGDVERAVQPYLSDPRVAYMPTGLAVPLAENWTRALNFGTAPYVAVLNDDDRWHPEYLAARVEALEAHPECGFAFSPWTLIDEVGDEIVRSPCRFAEGVVSRQVLAHAFVRENLVVPSAPLVRRRSCEEVGAAFEGNWHYSDWDLYARLAARFSAYYVASHDNEYRRHVSAYTFHARVDPSGIIEMAAAIEARFHREVDGFELTKAERRKARSSMLLSSAADVHQRGGWRPAVSLFLAALRIYPPAALQRQALGMYARSLGLWRAPAAR
jgi:glycosyltransferase involved in cell wall biosynthesis